MFLQMWSEKLSPSIFKVNNMDCALSRKSSRVKMFHNTARSCLPEKHKGTRNDTSPISKKYFSQNKLVEMVLHLRIKS